MDDKQELIQNIFRCTRRIIDKHTRIDEQPLRFDNDVVLSPREIRTVAFIGDKGEANVTDVAAHFHFTKSAASQLITRLVKNGLVSKETSPHSNKELRLSLTPHGRKAYQVFEKLMRDHHEEFNRRIDAFSLQQVATAAVLLEVMESIVDDQLKRLENGTRHGAAKGA